MLSDEETRLIEEAREAAGGAREACVEALAIVQERRGWVGDEVAGIARLLGLAAEEVDALATFSSLVFRRPVGKHVILVCDSVACWTTGSDGILSHLRRRLGVDLGGTTPDEEFTLLPAACLGACEQAPAMIVDGVLHGNLTPEKVDRILEERLR